MSETETVIMCTHDGQPEHLWRPGDGCPDAIPAGTWSVRPASLADTSDPRFTDDQRATLARFEAAPTPPEIVEAAVLEEVARELWELRLTTRDNCRTIAAAAVAVYRAQDGGAEEAVRRVVAVLDALDQSSAEAVLDYVRPVIDARVVSQQFRDALAPQAGDGAR